MPIKKSAKKALRQNRKRRIKNLQKKKKIKDLQKRFKKLILEKKFKEAQNLLPQVYKFLDKAAKTGLIKKSAASRRKSRLTKFLLKSQQ